MWGNLNKLPILFHFSPKRMISSQIKKALKLHFIFMFAKSYMHEVDFLSVPKSFNTSVMMLLYNCRNIGVCQIRWKLLQGRYQTSQFCCVLMNLWYVKKLENGHFVAPDYTSHIFNLFFSLSFTGN